MKERLSVTDWLLLGLKSLKGTISTASILYTIPLGALRNFFSCKESWGRFDSRENSVTKLSKNLRVSSRSLNWSLKRKDTRPSSRPVNLISEIAVRFSSLLSGDCNVINLPRTSKQPRIFSVNEAVPSAGKRSVMSHVSTLRLWSITPFIWTEQVNCSWSFGLIMLKARRNSLLFTAPAQIGCAARKDFGWYAGRHGRSDPSHLSVRTSLHFDAQV